MEKLIHLSVVTCPECRFQSELEMPSDSCQISHTCTNCGNEMHPKEGDCCIFCSYGSVACPPVQCTKN